MTIAVKQRVTVGPDGSVRVQSEQFRPGAEAEVIVLVEPPGVNPATPEEEPDDGPIPPGESAYDAFVRSGLIGTIGKYDDPSIPSDLSTNPKYMEDFGKDPGEAASHD